MPDDGMDSDRRREGVKRRQAFVWNYRNHGVDVKGDAEATKIVRQEYRSHTVGRTSS
jgi:hypothetical protein